ncbi:MAG: DUF262 domain-containing protein [Clostridiales bacterium]|nr:DUF262 domain-containing protein [Clostridiales bacterium]
MAIERRSTTQDLSWFLDLDANGQIDLNPPYQRRSVWSPKDRRFFLDTIFRGYPSPPIFLHKQIIDGKTIYSVVDGKQRLETILRFVKNKIAIDKDYGDIRLNGKKWKNIKTNDELARIFWDYVIPVEFTNIFSDSTLINDIFDRLNRNSRKLVEQELRHAKYDGWFISFVEGETESSDWKDLYIVTTSRRTRMKDVQFLSELLLIILKDDISGFSQNEITEFYAKYDELNDLDFSFDEELVKNRFANAKKYMFELEESFSIISNYSKDFTNFYSLWSIIALNYDRLPTIQNFAEKYTLFMNEVLKLKESDYLKKTIDGEVKLSIQQTLNYVQNSTGASTEEPQRIERNVALRSYLFED